MQNIRSIQILPEQAEALSSISMELEFEAVCPIPGKPYGGFITVSYCPDIRSDKGSGVDLIEWNSLQAWLNSLRSESYTAEGMAGMVAKEIKKCIGFKWLLVNLEVTSAFHLPVVVVVEL